MIVAETSDTVRLIRFQQGNSCDAFPLISEYFKKITVNPPPVDEDTQYILSMAARSPSFEFLKDDH